MDTQNLVEIATIASPAITLALTGLGWFLVLSDSKNTSARAEVFDILNSMIKTSLALNQRSAESFLGGKHIPGSDQAWVASVSVEISALRAMSGVLKEIHSINVPDDFFYALRKTFTLDAEQFSKYTPPQVIQKIALQNTQTSKSLKIIYSLFPSRKKE